MYGARLCFLVSILVMLMCPLTVSAKRKPYTGFDKKPLKVLRSGRDHSSRFIHAVLSMPYGDFQLNVSATFNACNNDDCTDVTEVGYVENVFDHSNPRVELTQVFANIFELTYELERPYTRVQTILKTNAHVTSEVHLACRAGHIPNGNSCQTCPANYRQYKNVCEKCPTNYRSPAGSWHCMENDITEAELFGNLSSIMADLKEEFLAEHDRDMTIEEENDKIHEWVPPVVTTSRAQTVQCESTNRFVSTKKKKRSQEERILDQLRKRSDFDIKRVHFRETLRRDTTPVDFSSKMIKAARKRGIQTLVRQPGENNRDVAELCYLDKNHKDCCTGHFNDSAPEVFVLDTGDQQGSWAVLCDQDNNPKVKIVLRSTIEWFTLTDGCYRKFFVWCWRDNRWEGLATMWEDNEFPCEGRMYYIGSVSTIPSIPENSLQAYETSHKEYCSDLSDEWDYWDCCQRHEESICKEVQLEFGAHDCCESQNNE